MKADAPEVTFRRSRRPEIAQITNHGYGGPEIPIGGAPDTGGQNFFVNTLALVLERLGYKVTIFARGGEVEWLDALVRREAAAKARAPWRHRLLLGERRPGLQLGSDHARRLARRFAQRRHPGGDRRSRDALLRDGCGRTTQRLNQAVMPHALEHAGGERASAK